MCACGFRHHRQDRIPREDLATRIRVMLVEHQANFRRLMAALLDRGPGLEVVAQAGSLSQARRRTAMVRVDLTVLDLVAALQALTEPAWRVCFGFTGQSHKAKRPPDLD